jgi:hypothetical protein
VGGKVALVVNGAWEGSSARSRTLTHTKNVPSVLAGEAALRTPGPVWGRCGLWACGRGVVRAERVSRAAESTGATTGEAPFSPAPETHPHPRPTRSLLIPLPAAVASQCGFTPQYKGLEELYQKYKDRGFTIVGFPCNQFGAQEPGTEEQIKDFACTKFKASFPVRRDGEGEGGGGEGLAWG